MTDPNRGPAAEREALEKLKGSLASWREQARDYLAKTERPPVDPEAGQRLEAFVKSGGPPRWPEEQSLTVLGADFVAGLAEAYELATAPADDDDGMAELDDEMVELDVVTLQDWERERVLLWQAEVEQGVDLRSLCLRMAKSAEPRKRAVGVFGLAQVATAVDVDRGEDPLTIFGGLGDEHPCVRRASAEALESLRGRFLSCDTALRRSIRSAIEVENPFARPFLFIGEGGTPEELARFCNEVAWKLEPVRRIDASALHEDGPEDGAGGLLLVGGLELLGTDEAGRTLLDVQARFRGWCVAGLAAVDSSSCSLWNPEFFYEPVTAIWASPAELPPAEVALTLGWCLPRAVDPLERVIVPRFEPDALDALLTRDAGAIRSGLEDVLHSGAGTVERAHVEGVLPARSAAACFVGATPARAPAETSYQWSYDEGQISNCVRAGGRAP